MQLLAQGRASRRRPAAFQDRQAAAENLVRISSDPAGFLPRGLEAQGGSTPELEEDDAGFRKSVRSPGKKGRPSARRWARMKLEKLPRDPGQVLSREGLAPSNCCAVVEARPPGSREPLTLKTHIRVFLGGEIQGENACLPIPAAHSLQERRRGKNPQSPSARSLRPMSPDERR